MNINESIRDKRKLVEKLKWYTFKITFISTVKYLRIQNLVPNQSWCIRLDYKIWYQIKV